MAQTSSLPDVDLDAVLQGAASTRDEQALERLVLALRRDQVRRGAPPMSPSLRAQLARPVPASVPPRRRRRIALAGVAGLLVGGATLGVAGAQNALPTALQDATARAATIVGVDLPDSHEHHEDKDSDKDRAGEDGTTSGQQRPQGTNVDPGGPPPTTKSGTQPADPGTPGDREPATPALPADGKADRGASGNANGSQNGTGPGTSNPNANPNPKSNANPNAIGDADASGNADAAGTHDDPGRD